MKSSLEIERRFLVAAAPAAVGRIRGEEIRQGYLTADPGREIRVRMRGGACVLTVKEGAGLVRKEVEIRLSRTQFDQLWPLTEGRRIEKTRYTLRHRGVTVELDIYEGMLAPLQVAEVEFPSVEASERFVKPAYCGEEITEREDYRNAALALHGLPQVENQRIGALPYLFKRGKLHVVLVTNTGQTRWILPKGQSEKGLTRHEVALMESVEEAGVIGTFASGMHDQCCMKDGTVLNVYPLAVSTLLRRWPEAPFRKRQVVQLAKAIRLINDANLAACVERVGRRIEAAAGQVAAVGA